MSDELDPLDFGHGVLGRWKVNQAGDKIGVIYSHPMPNPPVPGRRCFGSISFDTTCGHHGFIRQGVWVPA